MKTLIVILLFSIYSFGEIVGCKYKEDLIKLESINSNKLKFMFDNHCANIYNPSNWNNLKQEETLTLIQSPHKGEENYQYWVKSSELSKKIEKLERIVEKKNDYDNTFKYGDLIWQDNLITETKLMFFKEAKSYCKNLNYKGIKEWRLPTISELRQIRPASCQSEYQPYKDFKHLQLSKWYWSSDITEQFVFSSGATSAPGEDPAFVKCVAKRK